MRRRGWLLLLVAALPFARGARAEGPTAPAPVDNVLIVTFDGFRWQELFGGYDGAFNTKNDGGVAAAAQEPLKARFERATPQARRETLLPFFWTVVAREGQVFGDASRKSRARITNGLWFSYPGYNEMLSAPPTRGSTATTRRSIPT